MDLPNAVTHTQAVTDRNTEDISLSHSVSIDAVNVPNAVLQRLIEEVKHESQNNITAYNRLHNRHNRSR